MPHRGESAKPPRHRRARFHVRPAPISRMNAANLLDRPLPVWLRVAVIALCALVPTVFVARIYQHQHDFTPLIFFGQYFEPHELPEVRALHPEIQPGFGYDGQFYAQMALDPTMRRHDMSRVMDGTAYRGQRIFLPALAWMLGAGRPRLIVANYALLNLAFFYALLAAVARRLPTQNVRGYLVLCAIMLGSGTLVSVQYAMTDLPCATLGFMALGQGELAGAVLIAFAILTKPTGGLFLVRELAPLPRTPRAWLMRAGVVALALVLPVLWQIYLWRLFGRPLDASQITWPLHGWWQRVAELGGSPHTDPFPWRDDDWIVARVHVLEMLALVSTLVQVIFIFARPRWRDPLWLVGFCFAVLFLTMGEKNLGNAADYTRTLLPMSIAFHFALLELRSTPAFLAIFAAGNIGMMTGLGQMIFVSCH
jgi:hypothetical protein